MKDLECLRKWASFLAWNSSDPRLAGTRGAISAPLCPTEALERTLDGLFNHFRCLSHLGCRHSIHAVATSPASPASPEPLISRSYSSLLLRLAIKKAYSSLLWPGLLPCSLPQVTFSLPWASGMIHGWDHPSYNMYLLIKYTGLVNTPPTPGKTPKWVKNI